MNTSSIIDRFTVENGKIFKELYIENGIKNVEFRNCQDGGLIYLYTKIEKLVIIDSYIHKEAEILYIRNVLIENTQFDDFEIVSNGNEVEIRIINSKLRGNFVLENFNSFTIQNSTWNNFGVDINFVSTFNVGNYISFTNVTTNAKIRFLSVQNIAMNGLIVHNSVNSNFLYLMIMVGEVSLTNCSFEGNQVLENYHLLTFQMVHQSRIENCRVFNNRGSFLLATFATYLDGHVNIDIVDSVFQSNTLSGSPLFEFLDRTDQVFFVKVVRCKFIENKGGGKGSALHVDGGFFTIDSSEFYSNKAESGGSVYSTVAISIDNSKFIGNQAQIGGAMYLGPFGGVGQYQKFICQDNFASYAGGCIYSESLTFSLVHPSENNTAGHYGDNIATKIVNLEIQFDDKVVVAVGNNENRTIELYPGQSFQLNMLPRDTFNHSTSYLLNQKLNIFSTRGDFTISQNYLNGNHSIPVILQIFPSQMSLNPLLTSLSISITPTQSNNNIEQVVNVKILPCPSSYLLKESPTGHYCEYVPFVVILPSAILGFISLLIIFGGAIVVIRKLLKLRKQERAEQKIELKFKNKEFIFENEQSPLLLSERYNNNSNGRGNINSVDTTNIIKYKTRNQQQYIIPISEITILKKIGEGAMGVVYHAKWNRTDVAIKQLKTDANDEEFENEAILMSSMRHPCIVSCYGVSLTTNNGKYMIVEYLENGSLEKAIYNSRIGKEILRFETKLKILIDISKGMVYLHSIKPHRIIHRDLKPGNLLLDKNMNAKVADFGLSKIVSNNSATMTSNVGTLLYMAPELLSNNDHKGQSTKVDVYSFGIIMWELLFEILAFSNEIGEFTNVFQILRKVTEGYRPSLLFSTTGSLEDKKKLDGWIEHNFTKKQIKTTGKSKIIECLESYIRIMEHCWSNEPDQRPEFIEIIDKLVDLQSTLLS